jgi:hypothetical protein
LIDLSEVRDAAKQVEKTREMAIGARASWTAVDAEAKVHTAKLEELIGDTVWPDQLRAFLRAGKDLLVLLGWPLALVLTLVYVLHSETAKDRIAILAKSVQKVGLPGGVEVTLWGDEFRQNQSDTFARFRADVRAEYDKQAERFTIKDTLNRILKDVIEPELKLDDGRSPHFLRGFAPGSRRRPASVGDRPLRAESSNR